MRHRSTPRFSTTNRRPVRPPRVRGDVTVASFNLKYFLNGSGGDPASFPLGGGQTTFSEYQRQRAKLIATLADLNADIVGLIYKPATVTPVGPLVWLYSDAFANPNCNIFKLNRPALTQTFDTAIGAFTVSVNHFKSKGCSPPPSGLDVDLGDGQACFNDTRTMGAAELLDWFANDPTNTNASLGLYDPDVLIIGDLNSHPAEDPVAVITAGWDGIPGTADDWTDLLSTSDYSFVFQGQSSRLDYAIASPSLASQVRRAEVWHINAAEPDAFGYPEDNPAPAALYAPDPFRSSDHDALVIGLDGRSP